MASSHIIIRGAREHNLKNINLELPRNKLIVITGLSGSGKSSLAFDTIYAEGQRRYVESLSAYARQFLEQMDKPDVDYIEGLSPAISIEQKSASKNPRSTVGTVTEIYDYLRLLFARVGTPYCEKHGELSSQTVPQIVDQLLSLGEGTKLQVLAPIVRGRKGEYRKELNDMLRRGFVRARVDGTVRELGREIRLNKQKKHDLEIVVDRLAIREGIRSRLADSVETALGLGEGVVYAEVAGRGDLVFSEKLACIRCGISYPEVTPRIFSFNSPHGACQACDGLGTRLVIDADLVVPDPALSVREGAIRPWPHKASVQGMETLQALADHYGFDVNTPFRDLPAKVQQVLLHGSRADKIRFSYDRGERRYFYEREFEGIVPSLQRRYDETTSPHIREEIEQYMRVQPCPSCGGSRLRPESLAVKIAGLSIASVCRFSVAEAGRFFDELRLGERAQAIAERILKEIRQRLGFLADVGLDYLTLDRTAASLSGGEGQRIRLATQIGSSLVGVLYILDEPSIGLHQRDNGRLLRTLKTLRDLGNTVVVVEHDRETILSSDYVVDLGPGAGEHGGRVVAAGSPRDIMEAGESLTGQYLAGRRAIPVPAERRRGSGQFLSLEGCTANNLKNLTVRIPLGKFTCITGVSGSGKSTLMIDILYQSLAQRLYRSNVRPGAVRRVLGAEHIDNVIDINQSPIGRTPRSNPATYTGLFSDIRDLFAQVPEARARGYRPGRFSFNVKGGRCEACEGDGVIKIEMHFLPDIYVTCEVCKGKRFNPETLDVRYKGKNIAEVLEMTVSQSLEFFANVPKVRNRLQTIHDVGLSYIRLGQPATTLSGGEAQRAKLSKELSKRSTGRTLYILDEPTTGLHFADIQKLLDVLDRLADAGNTIVVIEHNLDVIKVADHIIDLGPEGGDRGGEVVAEGEPEAVVEEAASYTGHFLRKVLYKEGGVRVA